MIRTLLIANRGEIACRIMRTAQARGVVCVAVYSDADAGALHVRLADRAVRIGTAPPSDSYLRGDRIIQAALDTGAEAIHPGYGFLSENAEFVADVEAAGLIFVGPSAEAIRAMGLKDRAKALMERAGVPVVQGYHGADQDAAVLARAAAEIGYPVLIKAVAGGGGKGMRLVEAAEGFSQALDSARAEARTAFGNDAVLVEKYITAPRHIEVQVFGDGTRAVHLYERDCSLQRRHQKVIEEAPAPHMPEAVRAAMGEAAVRAAQAIGYKGAGTVEFIVDGSGPLRTDGFWFMEMNTRLQVEHPVTEAILGVDLVEWQLRVASGEPLPAAQSDLVICGHAFEARLYAEDVPAGFLPAAGRITHLVFPDTVRADTGVAQGDDVPPHYDPMIAKIITHGPDRAQALAALQRGLAATQVAGTVTNLGFLGALAHHEGFAAGQVDTGLIARDLEGLTTSAPPSPADLAQAAMALAGLLEARDPLTGFALHVPLVQTVEFDARSAGGAQQVRVSARSADAALCEVAGSGVEVVRTSSGWRFGGALARGHVMSDAAGQAANQGAGGRCVTLFGAQPLTLWQADPLERGRAGPSGDAVLSPMPGLLREVCVAVGDSVCAGDRLAVLEAMKMEHLLRAPRAGIVAQIAGRAGDQVAAGVAIVALEPEKQNPTEDTKT